MDQSTTSRGDNQNEELQRSEAEGVKYIMHTGVWQTDVSSTIKTQAPLQKASFNNNSDFVKSRPNSDSVNLT